MIQYSIVPPVMTRICPRISISPDPARPLPGRRADALRTIGPVPASPAGSGQRCRGWVRTRCLVIIGAADVEVMFAQKSAAGIFEAQNGHSLVGSAATGTGLFQRLTMRTRIKIAKATMTKSTTLFRKMP